MAAELEGVLDRPFEHESQSLFTTKRSIGAEMACLA